MTPNANDNMRSACHALAEHVLRMPSHSNRCKWLKQQVADLLKSQPHIDYYAKEYWVEYPYADAPTEYLAEVLKAFDQEDV